MRLRDAASAVRASAFAIAVPASDANAPRRRSVSGESGSSLTRQATRAPQVSPVTVIGAATADLIGLMSSPIGLGRPGSSGAWSDRSGRPVLNAAAIAGPESIGTSIPSAATRSAATSLELERIRTWSPGSTRTSVHPSAATSLPACSATRRKTASSSSPRATSVATRSSAPCSEASSRSSCSTRSWSVTSRPMPTRPLRRPWSS